MIGLVRGLVFSPTKKGDKNGKKKIQGYERECAWTLLPLRFSIYSVGSFINARYGSTCRYQRKSDRKNRNLFTRCADFICYTFRYYKCENLGCRGNKISSFVSIMRSSYYAFILGRYRGRTECIVAYELRHVCCRERFLGISRQKERKASGKKIILNFYVLL